MSSAPSVQRRDWRCTLYKLADFDPQKIVNHKSFQYLVYQKEKCPETQREHYQVFIQFTRTIRGKTVQELCGDTSCHLDSRTDYPDKAAAYCQKEDTRIDGPWEFGEFKSRKPGKRNDLVSVRNKIREKRKYSEIMDDDDLVEACAKYPKFVEKVFFSVKRQKEPQIELYEWEKQVLELLRAPPVHRRIIWIWSSGVNTGKTTFAAYCEYHFDVLQGTKLLWDMLQAYKSHEIIWFDFTKAQSGYESYSNLETLSNHKTQLSTKGDNIQKYIEAHIVVTSNHPPDEERLPQRFLTFNVDLPFANVHQSDDIVSPPLSPCADLITQSL